jgi:hypothetical protein
LALFYKYVSCINPISYLVFFTLIVGLVFLYKKKFKFLLLILFISSLTEISAFILLKNNKDLNYLYSFFFIIHNGLWLLLIGKVLNRKIINTATILFWVFGILNILFFEGSNLNYMTFVIGSLLYISIFAIESYHQLKTENLNYFLTNTYFLLFVPILFFFGFSFIFSFRNLAVKDSLIFRETDLYNCISHFVNITYYSLINFYIYREYQLKND